ncbi:hypothetical protein [Bremerella sp.]|uniref:hypothetical protein n=1 Tax=Bremerella sp. TaxID=2795602 RepID=UPI00391AF764
MGYVISAHVTRQKPDVSRLAEIPASIGYCVYYHRSADVYMIDAFRASRPPDYPFQKAIPATDIPLELPAELSDLELVYRFLDKQRLANSFKKSYINFGLLLNGLLGMPVLSFLSDDEEWDFACTVDQGKLARLKCRCSDLLITYEGGKTHVQPLAPEFEEENFLTNLDDLRVACPKVSVAERNVDWDIELHTVAIEHWRQFSDSSQLILGLGSFDPPEDESDWQLLSRSKA